MLLEVFLSHLSPPHTSALFSAQNKHMEPVLIIKLLIDGLAYYWLALS